MAPHLADPSDFAVAVAGGYAHVVEKVLGFLERASPATTRSPAADVLLALAILVPYLLVVTVAFVVRVAVDVHAYVVAFVCDCFTLVQAAAVSPAAVLEWFADQLVKIANSFIFRAVFGTGN
ncbi:hypothetical protein ACP70R_042472 [Stipagrostis hirtigluma subsp. patula]